jgi:hypothetical protein
MFVYRVKSIVKRLNLLKKTFSHTGEEKVIQTLLSQVGAEGGYAIDVAASDGVTMSNTLSLYKTGWRGLAVEYDPIKFAKLANEYKTFPSVNLTKCKVTPPNVRALFSANSVPTDFEFLNLDIDGYDFYVLKEILGEYRPKVICTEINEKIPPPIKFSVKWNENYCWSEDHFYGQSISKLYELCEEFDYSLAQLHYNNAFLMPSELSKNDLSPEEAYKSGYYDKSDRKEKFPWNTDMEPLFELDPNEKIDFINDYFSKYKGQYEAYIDKP